MVCGDAFLLDFWCGFAEIFILFLFLFAVLQFYETKRFAVFRIQCGLRFSYAGAPVLCYSLRFLNVCLCCYAVFLTPPPPHQTLTPPSNFDLKTELGHYTTRYHRTEQLRHPETQTDLPMNGLKNCLLRILLGYFFITPKCSWSIFKVENFILSLHVTNLDFPDFRCKVALKSICSLKNHYGSCSLEQEVSGLAN